MRTVALLCWFYSWSSFMPSVWVRDVPCASVPAFLIQDHSEKASWAPAHSSGDSQAPGLQMCFFGAGWSPGSLCADGLLPYIMISLPVCAYVFISPVPCNLNQLFLILPPASLGWISQQCAGRAASLIPFLFGLSWASVPGPTCWHLAAVTLVEEPPQAG